MRLYEEIILLRHWFEGKWLVENVIPYYKPLALDYQIRGDHIFWANFHITELNFGNRNHRNGTIETLSLRKDFDLSSFDITNKRQILRNCVEPELGLHCFNEMKRSLKNA